MIRAYTNVCIYIYIFETYTSLPSVWLMAQVLLSNTKHLSFDNISWMLMILSMSSGRKPLCKNIKILNLLTCLNQQGGHQNPMQKDVPRRSQFFLSPISYSTSGDEKPWPECQPQWEWPWGGVANPERTSRFGLQSVSPPLIKNEQYYYRVCVGG